MPKESNRFFLFKLFTPMTRRILQSIRFALILSGILFSIPKISAQCNLACVSELTFAPLQPGGALTLSYQDVVAGALCPGHLYSFTQNPADSVIILPFGTQDFVYTITDLTSGNQCWGQIIFRDPSPCPLNCLGSYEVLAPEGETVDVHFSELISGSICSDHQYSFTNDPADSIITVDQTTQSFLYYIHDLTEEQTCWGNLVITPCGGNLPADSLKCKGLTSFSFFPRDSTRVNPKNLVNRAYMDCSFQNLDIRAIHLDSSDHVTPPPPGNFSLYSHQNGLIIPMEVWLGNGSGRWLTCTTPVTVSTVAPNGKNFIGAVFLDADSNCGKDSAESGLEDWVVQVKGFPSGNTATTLSGADGKYFINVNTQAVNDTLYELQLVSQINYNGNCPGVYQISPNPGNELFENDFGVQISQNCPALTVDIGSPRLRRCFYNNLYVNYCNYGSEAATDAYVEVELDTFLVYNFSSITPSEVNGNYMKFNVGDIPSGECGSFSINVYLKCAALLGQTHCTEVHIYPDTFCTENAQWSGALLITDAWCDGDSVRLELKNAGTGNMLQSSNYIIVEDIIMYRAGSVQLDAGQSQIFSMPANGATWTIQADQVADFPNPIHPSVSLEGCGTNAQGSFTTGVVNLFPQTNPEGIREIDCQQNLGSYDPNDKIANPQGYGEEHFILPGTTIEYTIRFQNTGTDTAFTVRVEDKLDESLDRTTITPGAASHPYTFSMEEGGILQFLFENILLPDSSTNLEGSNGFVKFSVMPKTSTPLGTKIHNSADIFFDFNDPVRTNKVTHTLAESFITVSVASPQSGDWSVSVIPNPFTEVALFKVEGLINKNLHLDVFNSMGQKMSSQLFESNQCVFKRNDLPPGWYVFKITDEAGLSIAGKMIIR